MNPTIFRQFQQAAGLGSLQAKEYEGQMTTRVSVPIQSVRWGTGRLEMTIGGEASPKFGQPKIELSIVLPGREVIDFNLHPKDLDSLVSQRTMDKLSK